jgi:hypothetical protein
MQSFYVWIICLTKAYEQQINSALLNAGYGVFSLAADGKVVTPGRDSSVVLAYRLDKIGEDTTYEAVYNLVVAILTKLNVRFHSVILTKPCYCVWTGSNFDLSDPDTLFVPPKKDMLN